MSKGASTQPSVDCSVPMSSCFSGRCFDTLAMRDLDRRSAAAQGLNEFDLMLHAGGAAFNYRAPSGRAQHVLPFSVAPVTMAAMDG